MALNHLNLTVPDVPQTQAFFETYFGFQCVAGRQTDEFVVLVDESGFVLTLNNFAKSGEVVYPGAFHVGFRQDSRQQVDALYQRLKADGFDMKPPINSTGAGRSTFARRAVFSSRFPPTGGRAPPRRDSLTQARQAQV
jgi:catechol 2,3-dioxygenase-like lactoylglutathione lyase family enzyme